jgi:hypothetical protein
MVWVIFHCFALGLVSWFMFYGLRVRERQVCPGATPPMNPLLSELPEAVQRQFAPLLPLVWWVAGAHMQDAQRRALGEGGVWKARGASQDPTGAGVSEVAEEAGLRDEVAALREAMRERNADVATGGDARTIAATTVRLRVPMPSDRPSALQVLSERLTLRDDVWLSVAPWQQVTAYRYRGGESGGPAELRRTPQGQVSCESLGEGVPTARTGGDEPPPCKWWWCTVRPFLRRLEITHREELGRTEVEARCEHEQQQQQGWGAEVLPKAAAGAVEFCRKPRGPWSRREDAANLLSDLWLESRLGLSAACSPELVARLSDRLVKLNTFSSELWDNHQEMGRRAFGRPAVPEELAPKGRGAVPEELAPKGRGAVPEELAPKGRGAVPEELAPKGHGAVPEELAPKGQWVEGGSAKLRRAKVSGRPAELCSASQNREGQVFTEARAAAAAAAAATLPVLCAEVLVDAPVPPSRLPKVVRPDLVVHAMEKVFVAKRGMRLLLRVEATGGTYEQAERRLWDGLGEGGKAHEGARSGMGQRGPLARSEAVQGAPPRVRCSAVLEYVVAGQEHSGQQLRAPPRFALTHATDALQLLVSLGLLEVPRGAVQLMCAPGCRRAAEDLWAASFLARPVHTPAALAPAAVRQMLDHLEQLGGGPLGAGGESAASDPDPTELLLSRWGVLWAEARKDTGPSPSPGSAADVTFGLRECPTSGSMPRFYRPGPRAAAGQGAASPPAAFVVRPKLFSAAAM